MNESRYNPYRSDGSANVIPEYSQNFQNDEPRSSYSFDGFAPNQYSFATKEEYERYLSTPPTVQQTPIIAILAIIFAFIFAPVGLVLGIVGLSQPKKLDNQTGKILSWVGIGVGGFQVIIFLLIFIFAFASAFSY